MKIKAIITTILLVLGCAFVQAQNNPQGEKHTPAVRQKPTPEQMEAYRKIMDDLVEKAIGMTLKMKK